jgi:cell division protein FtsZ
MPTHPPSTAPIRLPDESPQGARIKVVGVGGGGSNAIDRMIDFGVEGVEFIALNTDVQALEVSKAPVRGQLGSLLTNGLSAGSDPNVGRRAAIQDAAEIAEVLEGADMVFITAGLGGGTGTGAAPVIAAIAAEMGALTVAIVTRPFNFEGKRRMAIADWGIDHLLRYVDTLIVIPNEKLLAIAKDAPFFESFKIADDFLRQAVQGISDIITTEGVINRDFADVKTTMAGMGYAVMGTASRSGPTRAVDAVMDAMASPLLEEGAIDGARGILINITGSSTLRLSEVNAASRVIQNVAHEDANIIFGAVLDERLGDEVKATVIATGFRNDGRDRSERRARLLRATAPAAPTPEYAEPEPVAVEPEAVVEASTTEPSVDEAPLAEITPPHPPAAIERPSAEAVTVEAEEPQVEAIEIVTIEEEEIEVSESSFEEPEAEAIEDEQPQEIPEPIEEPAQPSEQPFAIEIYEGEEPQNLRVEDPPQQYLVEIQDLEPLELDAMEESRPAPLDEEDWKNAIREIARLAEPAFEAEDLDDDDAAEPAHRNRLADPRPGSESTGLERYQQAANLDPAVRDVVPHQAAPPKNRLPAAPNNIAEPAHLSPTRRAALAAYAAVSPLETEPETEPEAEPEQPQTKAVNAFAQVLEARRRFVENLGKNLPLEDSVTTKTALPSESSEMASPPAPQRTEKGRRFPRIWLAGEREEEQAEQPQALPSRPRTIEAEKSPANAAATTPLFKDTPAYKALRSGDLEADDLSQPRPASNRKLRPEGTEQRNGELFESHWNPEIPVPSFGSILERKSYTKEADE